MIITIIKNNKLFIQFDRLINNGMLTITTNDKQYLKLQNINNSEFEIIDLPDKLPEKLNIQIDIGMEKFFKTLKTK